MQAGKSPKLGTERGLVQSYAEPRNANHVESGGVVTAVVVGAVTGGRSNGGEGYRECKIFGTKKKINCLGNSTGEQ